MVFDNTILRENAHIHDIQCKVMLSSPKSLICFCTNDSAYDSDFIGTGQYIRAPYNLLDEEIRYSLPASTLPKEQEQSYGGISDLRRKKTARGQV